MLADARRIGPCLIRQLVGLGCQAFKAGCHARERTALRSAGLSEQGSAQSLPRLITLPAKSGDAVHRRHRPVRCKGLELRFDGGDRRCRRGDLVPLAPLLRGQVVLDAAVPSDGLRTRAGRSGGGIEIRQRRPQPGRRLRQAPSLGPDLPVELGPA
ncbi:hypothetical protein, partial [Inquilinus sp. CA228]|uniref:hypothetical protein n=1 Tax=Inquilinus sp. CA228 TaxID=3455609 RepID=UPI003F8D6273